MKYSTKADVEICIQILKIARDKTKDTYTEQKIKPSINRVIMDLEEFKSIYNGDFHTDNQEVK